MRVLPHFYFKSVTDITVSFLKEQSVRGVAVDIDNTLTEDNSFHIDEGTKKWVDTLKNSDIRICVVSNNHPDRVIPFVDQFEVPYIYEAKKPTRKSIVRLQEILQTDAEHIAMIGDQIFTDMLFAYRCHFTSILVDAVGEDNHRGAKLKRFFEKPLKSILRRRKI